MDGIQLSKGQRAWRIKASRRVYFLPRSSQDFLIFLISLTSEGCKVAMYHTKIPEVSKDYALYTFAILFLCLKQAPLKLAKFFLIPAGIYLLKVKNKNNKV